MVDSASSYRIRDVNFFGSPRRILMQSANGPCPLLASCNVLLLRNQLSLPRASCVSFEELIQRLSNLLLDLNDRERDEVRAANIQQSLESCIELLPKLDVGLDVNCCFGGPREFEYTRELCIFDLLDISIVHGWVVDPEDKEAVRVIGSSSYNVLAERLVQCEDAQCSDSHRGEELTRLLAEGAVIRGFLQRTASQLTYEGLVGLYSTLRDRELAVFFRNQHFGSLLKHDGTLYLLCTDVGFLDGSVVWERLDSVDGDTTYLGEDFKPPAMPAASAAPAPGMGLQGGGGLSTRTVRAPCPRCGSLNDFDIPGARSAVQCGACGHQFSVERPPAFVDKPCRKCGTLNRFPAPRAGQPAPARKCGVCGDVEH